MPTLPPDDRVAGAPWEKARAAEEADCCAAGPDHDHAGAVCRRGSACHCARPIGHPVPIEVHAPHAPRDPR